MKWRAAIKSTFRVKRRRLSVDRMDPLWVLWVLCLWKSRGIQIKLARKAKGTHVLKQFWRAPSVALADWYGCLVKTFFICFLSTVGGLSYAVACHDIYNRSEQYLLVSCTIILLLDARLREDENKRCFSKITEGPSVLSLSWTFFAKSNQKSGQWTAQHTTFQSWKTCPGFMWGPFWKQSISRRATLRTPSCIMLFNVHSFSWAK